MKFKMMVLLFLLYTVQINADDSIGSFRWALVENGQQAVSEEKQKILSPGEFTIFFQPIENAYLYVFLVRSDDSLTIIFPEDFRVYKKKYDTFIKWLPLDLKSSQEDKRVEAVHFIVSTSRQKDLEKMMVEYKGVQTEEKSQPLEKKIMSKIQWLKREFEMNSNISESPVPGMGVIRDGKKPRELNEEDIREITYKDLYAKTFHIEY